MTRTRVSKAARRRMYRERMITMILIISVSVGLFGVMGSVVATCYATQSQSSIAVEPDPIPTVILATPMVNEPLTITARLSTRTMSMKKVEASGERLTRMSGIVVDRWNEEDDYPQLMKTMLARAQEDPTNASLYLISAELYECQSNLKVTETGEGEITHIFGVWNEDLDEMDKLLYETYPFFPYTEHDVIRLASIIHMEAGSDFVTDDHQRDVASVPLNRLLSPEFKGDTLDEIIDAKNQYPNTCKNRKYTEREWDNALYVLQHGPTTEGVYQANFVVSTATEVLKIYEYPEHSWVRPTYICR